MNHNPQYRLEEYKFAKEKIRKNEERRFQMIVLAITAFGVIFGFSDKIEGYLIPLSLLTILIICANSYRSQSERQEFTAAYIIHEFENNIEGLNYESTLKNFDSSKSSNNFLQKILFLFDNWFIPFPILLLATILSFFYFGFGYVTQKTIEFSWTNIYIYISTNLLGYFFVIYTNIKTRMHGIEYYIKAFQQENHSSSGT